jgi:galactonate dehydratase
MITVPNFYRIESSRHDLSGYNRFLTTPLDNRDGRLVLPPGPGLGLDFDLDYLRANARDGIHG